MKKALIISIILLLSSLFILIFILFIKDDVKCMLEGETTVNTEIFEEYKEKGVKLVNKGKEVPKKEYELTITGNVNTQTLGLYKIEYIVKYHNKTYKLKRIVSVVDSTPPVINTNIESVTKDYCTKKDIEELSVTAVDNYDGDITEHIERVDTDESIVLTVQDINGNVAKKEIPIKFTQKPQNKFILNGEATIYVPINAVFEDPQANLIDGCGEKLDVIITTTGTVNTKVLGEYNIKYSTSDMDTITRIVKVYDPSAPSNKTIYLTFDDGPGIYTKKILDALSKYNVKATFFVTNQFPSYAYLIKEEYSSGHSIGVHTYTHKYDIYRSLDNYIDDFNKMNEIVKIQTGNYSKIFRFPGGASNTISKSYKIGIVSEIAEYMTKNGYIYFDWNVDSTDAAGASVDAIIKRVTTDVSKCSKCVVLMHDINKNTSSAIETILKNLTEKGYSFQVLTSDSPKIQHRISN